MLNKSKKNSDLHYQLRSRQSRHLFINRKEREQIITWQSQIALTNRHLKSKHFVVYINYSTNILTKKKKVGTIEPSAVCIPQADPTSACSSYPLFHGE